MKCACTIMHIALACMLILLQKCENHCEYTFGPVLATFIFFIIQGRINVLYDSYRWKKYSKDWNKYYYCPGRKNIVLSTIEMVIISGAGLTETGKVGSVYM